MNRKGKSRLNELLTQRGVQSITKTGMEVDKVWIDELIEQRTKDASLNLSEVVLTKEMTRQERKEAFLKAIDKQQNV